MPFCAITTLANFIAYSNIGNRCTTGYRTKVASRQSRRANVYEVGIASLNTFSDLLLLRLVAKELSVTETSSGIAEEIVWRGTSSQWRNFGVYLLCGLFCWLIVPIFLR